MAFANFVKETTTTTGTGNYDLDGAVTGFQTFVAGIGNGNSCRYAVTDGTDWEVVTSGTVTSGTPDTISRGTIEDSSNGGAAVNWGAGTKSIYQVASAADFDSFFLTANIDDVAVNGETNAPISSNWAYDHENLTAAHGATGSVVGTTNTQTLTNKTLSSPSITGTITEDVYNLTGTLVDPANGSIQYKTLSGNTTLTESLADGDAVVLMIDDGTAYTVTWPTMTWVGGSAPTLATSGYNVIVMWQANSVVYGSYIGAA